MSYVKYISEVITNACNSLDLSVSINGEKKDAFFNIVVSESRTNRIALTRFPTLYEGGKCVYLLLSPEKDFYGTMASIGMMTRHMRSVWKSYHVYESEELSLADKIAKYAMVNELAKALMGKDYLLDNIKQGIFGKTTDGYSNSFEPEHTYPFNVSFCVDRIKFTNQMIIIGNTELLLTDFDQTSELEIRLDHPIPESIKLGAQGKSISDLIDLNGAKIKTPIKEIRTTSDNSLIIETDTIYTPII